MKALGPRKKNIASQLASIDTFEIDECSQRGLTLIEIMIALTLFSVGILAVATMQVVSLKALSKSHVSLYNCAAAAAQIEYLLMLPYDSSELADPDDGFHPDMPDHGPRIIKNTGATIQWEVDTDYPVPGAKRIQVTIYQNTKDRRERLFTYEYVKSSAL